MAVSDRIAVMNQGSVVQEGSAADLYHRPATDFVAKFVGRVNSVPGRVAAIVDGCPTIDALGTALPARALPPGIAVGAAVQLMVRPEAVAIVAADAADALPATVAGCTFLGEKTEYELAVGGTTLQALRYNADPAAALSVGAAVGVRLSRDALTVLPPAGG